MSASIAYHCPCRSEAELEALGAALCDAGGNDQIITLSGTLGAGKTVLARGYIRRAVGDETVSVTSPTFTLLQTYSMPDGQEVWHYDLYRIEDVHELDEIGLEDALRAGRVLIEWPDIAQRWLPSRRISLHIEIKDDQSRQVSLTIPASEMNEQKWDEALRASGCRLEKESDHVA